MSGARDAGTNRRVARHRTQKPSPAATAPRERPSCPRAPTRSIVVASFRDHRTKMRGGRRPVATSTTPCRASRCSDSYVDRLSSGSHSVTRGRRTAARTIRSSGEPCPRSTSVAGDAEEGSELLDRRLLGGIHRLGRLRDRFSDRDEPRSDLRSFVGRQLPERGRGRLELV